VQIQTGRQSQSDGSERCLQLHVAPLTGFKVGDSSPYRQ
jgi:hypothetical protein